MPKIKTKKPSQEIPPQPTKKKGNTLADIADIFGEKKPDKPPKLPPPTKGAAKGAVEGRAKIRGAKMGQENEEEEKQYNENTSRKASSTDEEEEKGIREKDTENPTGYVPPTEVAEIMGNSDQPNESEAPSESVSVTMERQAPLPILSGKPPTGYVASELDKRKKLPVLGCSSCHIGQSCPEYAEGYVCAFNDAFSALKARDVESVLTEMGEIVSTNKARLLRAYFAEQQVNGGSLDMNVTRQSQVVMDQMQLLLGLHREQTRVTVTVQGPGIVEKKGPGILAQLLSRRSNNGNSSPTPSPEKESNPALILNENPAVDKQQNEGEKPILSEKTLAELTRMGVEPPAEPVPPPPGGQALPSP